MFAERYPSSMAVSMSFIAIQSVGQGEMQSPHPEQLAFNTVCIVLAEPIIESIGHAEIHSVHPMHRLSSIVAVVFHFDLENSGSSSGGSMFNNLAKAERVRCSPGQHRLIFAFPLKMASA